MLCLLQGAKPTKVLILHHSSHGHVETVAWRGEAEGVQTTVEKRSSKAARVGPRRRNTSAMSARDRQAIRIQARPARVDRVRCEISGPGRRASALDKLAANSVRLSHRPPRRWRPVDDPDVHSDTDALWHVAIASPTRNSGEVISQCKVVISSTSNVSGA